MAAVALPGARKLPLGEPPEVNGDSLACGASVLPLAPRGTPGGRKLAVGGRSSPLDGEHGGRARTETPSSSPS